MSQLKSHYERELAAARAAGIDTKDPEIRDWLLLCLARDQIEGYKPTKTYDPYGGYDERKHALNTAAKYVKLLRDCSPGNRNNQLNESAFQLGRVHAGGFITQENAIELLVEAGLHCGLSNNNEIMSTIQSGFNSGYDAGWQGRE